MTEPSGVPSVEEAILAATPHLGYCRFPDDACLCRALEIRTRLAPALASVLAEARTEALEQAAAAVRDVRENSLPAGVTSHPYSEHFENWLLARARRSVPESEGR